MSPTLQSNTHAIISWFQMTFPELSKQMHSVSHHYDDQTLNPYHLEGSIWSHTMMVCLQAKNLAPDNDIVRWSTLLHDIGKPTAMRLNHDTKKTSFHGHEGLSAFMTIDILNKTDIDIDDKIMIHKLIAMHGELFRFVGLDGKIKADILNTFEGEKTLLGHLSYQTVADSSGRFLESGRGDNIDSHLPNNLQDIVSQLTDGVFPQIDNSTPKLTMLVGPPCSGKSTWVENNANNKTMVISRDALVESAGVKHGMNYTDMFKFLNINKDIAHNEVDNVLTYMMNTARKACMDVVIDMTSMSKKSRRKWLSAFSKYDKTAIVFLTGLEELKRRNTVRSETGKYIPLQVMEDMCIKYSLPTYAEGFNSVEYIWAK